MLKESRCDDRSIDHLCESCYLLIRDRDLVDALVVEDTVNSAKLCSKYSAQCSDHVTFDSLADIRERIAHEPGASAEQKQKSCASSSTGTNTVSPSSSSETF